MGYESSLLEDTPKLVRDRVEETIKGVAKLFADDIKKGKKTVEEMVNDIINSEIPEEGKKGILYQMGLYTRDKD